MTPQMMEMMKINDELETLALVQPQQRFEIKIFSGFVLYPGQHCSSQMNIIHGTLMIHFTQKIFESLIVNCFK